LREPDKAGGEVVFSSDGLDPLQPPVVVRPPPLASAAAAKDKDNSDQGGDAQFAVVDEDGYDVYQALEALGVRPTVTSASERLHKIESDLHQLQLEAAEDQALQGRVAELQERLRKQQQQQQHQSSLHSEFASGDGGAARDASEAAALASPRSDVETLLLRLEKAVGSMHHHDPHGRGLLERVQALEESVGIVSETKLDALGAKVKVIRQDLEAASKAKNKLQMGSGSAGGGGGGGSAAAAADPKVIAELYDALQQVAPMQSLLPVVAQRLEALQGQHRQVSTFSSRLAALEASTTALETTLKSAEASAAKLEANWQSSVAPQLQANLQAIDERLAKLQGSSATAKQ
jgi:Dynamitin